MITSRYLSKPLFPVFSRRLLTVLGCLVILCIILSSVTLIVGFESSGGAKSVKVVGVSGAADSSLVIGTTSNDTSTDIALSPFITTVGATGVSMHEGPKATLNGRIDSMNGFPSTTIWWEWGYTDSYGNTVGEQTVASAGDYSVDIIGFDSAQDVYFTFGSNADGTLYGDGMMFQNISTGGLGGTTRNLSMTFVFVWLGIVLMSVIGVVWSGENAVLRVVIGGIGALLGISGFVVILTSVNAI